MQELQVPRSPNLPQPARSKAYRKVVHRRLARMLDQQQLLDPSPPSHSVVQGFQTLLRPALTISNFPANLEPLAPHARLRRWVASTPHKIASSRFSLLSRLSAWYPPIF